MKPPEKGTVFVFAGSFLFGALIFLLTASRIASYNFVERSFLKPLVYLFSPESEKLESRLGAILLELEGLPILAPPSNSGTTGYLSNPTAVGDAPVRIEFSFPGLRTIDALALIPSQDPSERHKNVALGLAPQMDVILLAGGQQVGRMSFESRGGALRIRKTHPYFAEFEPVEVDEVRIEYVRKNPNDPATTSIGEFFIFSGAESVTHEAVLSSNSSRRGVPGVDIDFIRDDQTGLGLPAVPEPHRYVGYRSGGKPHSDFEIVISMEWDKPIRLDEVRFYPVGRLLGAQTDAAGFPPQIGIAAWMDDDLRWKKVVAVSNGKPYSPGNNPVSLRFDEIETSKIRMLFPKLWKATERSAAILALSEIEPRLKGIRLEKAKLRVSTPSKGGMAADGPGGEKRIWGLAALNDGMTSDGRIVAERDWLRSLARRADLLIEKAPLEVRLAQLSTRLNLLFSSVVFGGLMTILCLILVLFFRQQSKHRREMREIRNRLAADLHDDLGSNLSTLSIYEQRLRRQPGAPSETLDPMQRLIRESLGSLKEMVSFTAPQISRPISLINRLKEIAEIHCGETPHAFDVAAGLENIEVSVVHRRSLRLFLKEAVNNCIRHSGATRIDFRIVREEDRRIWLSIRDNGKGLPEELLVRKNSLPTLRLRAEEMDASFRVRNLPEGGCEISVVVRVK